MIYFVLHYTGQFRFYSSIKKLCEGEDLGYSKFRKHFAKNPRYRDQNIAIWRGKPNENS